MLFQYFSRTAIHRHGANNPQKVYWELLSHSGCLGETDLIFLLEYLKRRGLVELGGINFYHEQPCTLTVEGYATAG